MFSLTVKCEINVSKHAIKCDLNVQIHSNNGVLWALEGIGLYAQLYHSVNIAVGLKASILMIAAGFNRALGHFCAHTG